LFCLYQSAKYISKIVLFSEYKILTGWLESLKFNAGIIDYISCPKIWPCLVRTGVQKCWIKST
jgi:hypothetical protein